MQVLVTGSSGLIGSEAVLFYDRLGADVVGIDNNMRRDFFGPEGDTTWNLSRLKSVAKHFRHFDIDIRNRGALKRLFEGNPFDLIIHCAAQPSHDLAAKRVFDDFDVNAVGTLNLLEFTRIYSPNAVFIYMSTNKVYGDAPNEIPLVELDTRYDYADDKYCNGIGENLRIDNSLHSLFGASKLAGDILTQEYGKYFSMRTASFRGGCLTGAGHSGVQLHGFLSYLIRQAKGNKKYTIFGYKGKQVRDNIHSSDVIAAFEAFRKNPKCGEIYNIGGGRGNSISVIEAIRKVEEGFSVEFNIDYDKNNRKGDHICYISDCSKFKSDYPEWDITKSIDDILDEMWYG